MMIDVWIDNDECWPRQGTPDPVATFDTTSFGRAVELVTESGEFDAAFERGGVVKLLMRQQGTRQIFSYTLEPVVEYRVQQSRPITLEELRNG